MNTSSLLCNMMFLALEHICTATQHDVSYTRRHLYCYATWCFLHWNTCWCYATWCLGVGCLFLGGMGVGWMVGWGGMFPFVALARILMLRNMLFLALEHIFTATQHDVSYTRRHLYCYATWCFLHNLCFTDEKKNLGVLAEIPEIFNLGTTWEHLYINGTLKRKAFRWRWLFTQTQLFYKNEKTEFRKILTNRFAFKHLIYNSRHLEWQCIISKKR